jgi:hypothetical protein
MKNINYFPQGNKVRKHTLVKNTRITMPSIIINTTDITRDEQVRNKRGNIAKSRRHIPSGSRDRYLEKRAVASRIPTRIKHRNSRSREKEIVERT